MFLQASLCKEGLESVQETICVLHFLSNICLGLHWKLAFSPLCFLETVSTKAAGKEMASRGRCLRGTA